MSIDQLTEKFSIEKYVSLREDDNGFVFIDIENEQCKACVCLYGGQIISFNNKSSGEMLFLSDKVIYKNGTPIRGGIPVCWPAFGASNPELPFHGFVRNRIWRLLETQQLDTHTTEIKLGISSNDETLRIWPYAFKLTLTVRFSSSINIELETENTGDKSFEITQALHTYFKVGDIRQVVISGLNGREYVDTTETVIESQIKQQDGDVIIAGEVDSIYLDTTEPLTIQNVSENRRVVIKASGASTTIVWNPWIDICLEKDDLADDAYMRFVCVESANAHKERPVISPQGKYQLHVEYSFIP